MAPHQNKIKENSNVNIKITVNGDLLIHKMNLQYSIIRCKFRECIVIYPWKFSFAVFITVDKNNEQLLAHSYRLQIVSLLFHYFLLFRCCIRLMARKSRFIFYAS